MAEESPLQLPKTVILPPPYLSKDLVSGTDPLTGSEFGGVDGIVQPFPHVPSASERLSMIYAIDPQDAGVGDRENSVAPPELEGF